MKYEDIPRGRNRAITDRVPSTPAKKNRRRWCRGKTGVEHQLEIRINNKAFRAEIGCHQWQPGKRWSRWICVEQEYCTQCGKIMQHSLGRNCTKRVGQ